MMDKGITMMYVMKIGKIDKEGFMITKKKLFFTGMLMLIVNVLVIVGVLYFTSEKLKENYAPPVSEETVEADPVADGDSGTAEEREMAGENTNGADLNVARSAEPSVSYKNVYSSLLTGEYVSEDGTAFKFAPDNSYSGYFNEEVPAAEYYSYEIINENETENALVIYNPNKQTEVKYSLDLDGEGNVVLSIPDTETKFVLCYDGTLYKGDKPETAEDTENTIKAED